MPFILFANLLDSVTACLSYVIFENIDCFFTRDLLRIFLFKVKAVKKIPKDIFDNFTAGKLFISHKLLANELKQLHPRIVELRNNSGPLAALELRSVPIPALPGNKADGWVN